MDKKAIRISEPEIPSFRAWNTQFQSLKHPVSNAWNTQFQGLEHPVPNAWNILMTTLEVFLPYRNNFPSLCLRLEIWQVNLRHSCLDRLHVNKVRAIAYLIYMFSRFFSGDYLTNIVRLAWLALFCPKCKFSFVFVRGLCYLCREEKQKTI